MCPGGTGVLADVNKCGNPASYCPSGSASVSPTPQGFFAIETTAGSGLYYNVSRCEPGYYCVDGVSAACQPGRFGDTWGLFTDDCTGLCTAGYFCDAASIVTNASACSRDASHFCAEVRRS